MAVLLFPQTMTTMTMGCDQLARTAVVDAHFKTWAAKQLPDAFIVHDIKTIEASVPYARKYHTASQIASLKPRTCTVSTLGVPETSGRRTRYSACTMQLSGCSMWGRQSSPTVLLQYLMCSNEADKNFRIWTRPRI